MGWFAGYPSGNSATDTEGLTENISSICKSWENTVRMIQMMIVGDRGENEIEGIVGREADRVAVDIHRETREESMVEGTVREAKAEVEVGAGTGDDEAEIDIERLQEDETKLQDIVVRGGY